MPNYNSSYTDAEIDTIVTMWNAGKLVGDIAAALERSKNQIQDKVKHLRSVGINLPVRFNLVEGNRTRPFSTRDQWKIARDLQKAEADREAKAEKERRQRLPNWVRFEDDVRAKADRGSPYMPKATYHQMGGSSLA